MLEDGFACDPFDGFFFWVCDVSLEAFSVSWFDPYWPIAASSAGCSSTTVWLSWVVSVTCALLLAGDLALAVLLADEAFELEDVDEPLTTTVVFSGAAPLFGFASLDCDNVDGEEVDALEVTPEAGSAISTPTHQTANATTKVMPIFSNIDTRVFLRLLLISPQTSTTIKQFREQSTILR